MNLQEINKSLCLALDEICQIQSLVEYSNFANDITIQALQKGDNSIENGELDGLYLQNKYTIEKISNLYKTLEQIYLNTQKQK